MVEVLERYHRPLCGAVTRMSHHSHPQSLLTPAMRGVIDRIHRAAQLPMHAMNPQQARAFYEAGAGVLDMAPHAMQRVDECTVPTRDGQVVPARLYVPASAASAANAQDQLPVLLYFHGGGFTVGSIHTHDVLCRHLAHVGHCAVVSVGYRLAPEWPFPTAVCDAWDSLAWLREQAATLGLDAEHVAVGGDSAGGTLAITTALHARDQGWPLRLQLLFYPGCVGHQNTPSHKRFAQGFILEEPHISYFFEHYLPRAQDRNDWRFAPLDGTDEHGHTPDPHGVAPAWIGLAECDLLVDEGVTWGDHLRLHGVPVDLEIYRGVVHGFIQFGRAIPEALQAHNDAGRALRQALEN